MMLWEEIWTLHQANKHMKMFSLTSFVEKKIQTKTRRNELTDKLAS